MYELKWNNFVYRFPREDEGSPRLDIIDRFCKDQMTGFRACMTANDFNENKCLDSKKILDKCSAAAFKDVNADINATFWAGWRRGFLLRYSFSEMVKHLVSMFWGAHVDQLDLVY